MLKTLYLIRHAQSHPSRDLPDPQWPLSEWGRHQARRLVDVLATLGIEEVHSSPYVRCRDTIAPFIDRWGVSIHEHHDLRERRVAATIIDNFPEVWRRSWEDFSFALPGCETSHAAQRRVLRTVHRICETTSAATIAINSHGNALSLLLHHADSSFHLEAATSMRNPDVYRMTFRPGALTWDSQWRAPQLDDFATHHEDTPFPQPLTRGR